MINIIKKIAIVEKSTQDKVVILDNISEGIDGSSVFGFSNEPKGISVNDAQFYQTHQLPSVDIRVLKPSSTDIAQLESWAENQTDIYACLLTVDGVIYFGQWHNSIGASKIVLNEQLSDNDIFAFKITSKTEIGFSPSTGLHQGGVWMGENMIGAYEWNDVNSDNSPDGFLFNFQNASFNTSTKILTFDYNNGGSDILQVDVLFPFEGQPLTASLTVDTYTVNSGSPNPKISISWRDKDGVAISSNSSNITSSGRVSVTGTAPSGTVVARIFYITQTDNNSNVDWAVSFPMLSSTGSTTYTKF